VSVLRDLPLFKCLSNTEFEALHAVCREEEYFDGDVLFNEGDPAESVHVIKRGCVRVVRRENGRQVDLASLYNGEFFGEMGVLNNSPRSAGAVVSGSATILTIPGPDFVRTVAANPTMSKMVMSTMVGRFKTTSADDGSPATPRCAVTIGVFSASGGCGTSLVTANLAAAIARAAGGKVLVFDLSLMFGDQAEILGLDGGPSLSDVVGTEVVDVEGLRACIQSTPAGVDVIRSPAQPEHAEVVMPGFVISCLELLRTEYDWILCDTAHLVHEGCLSLLEQVRIPIYVMTAEVLSVKNASKWFSIMQRLQMSTDAIRLLFNKYEPTVDGETVEFVRQKFGKEPLGLLPLDGRTAKASLNTGKLIVLEQPETELAKALTEAAATLTGTSAPEAKDEPFWRRWIQV